MITKLFDYFMLLDSQSRFTYKRSQRFLLKNSIYFLLFQIFSHKKTCQK